MERDEPVWMNRDGKVCEEKGAFGCKFTHNITDPDNILMMDEVSGNTSHKGDDHLGGELMLCEC